MFIKTICHAEQDWGNGNIKSQRTPAAEMSYNKMNGGEAELTPPCSVITLRLVSFADHFLSRPLPLNIHVEGY